jgi:hypothetical protein
MHRSLTRFRLAALAIALAVPCLFATAARAQGFDSPYRYIQQEQHVDLFGTYLSPSAGRLGAGPNSGMGGGLRWGTGISGPLAFEFEASFSPLKRPVVDTAFAPDSSRVVKGEADMGLLMAMGNVRFNLTGQRTWHSIQPFLLFGGGIAMDLSKEGGADTLVASDVRFKFGTSFAGSVGAGFEYFVSPRIGARVDGSMLLWKLKAPTAFITRGPGVIPASEWERNSKVTAGLSLHF